MLVRPSFAGRHRSMLGAGGTSVLGFGFGARTGQTRTGRSRDFAMPLFLFMGAGFGAGLVAVAVGFAPLFGVASFLAADAGGFDGVAVLVRHFGMARFIFAVPALMGLLFEAVPMAATAGATAVAAAGVVSALALAGVACFFLLASAPAYRSLARPLRHLRRRIAVARKSVVGRDVRVLN